MFLKAAQAALVSSICLFLLAVSGCAWETTTNHQNDAGDGDARDGENGIDEGPQYPPGPYGTDFGDTVENFKLVKCLCPGGPAQGKDVYLEEFLGAKAVLVTAHSGTCTYCKQQAATMEDGLWIPYRNQGLKIILVLIDDDHNISERQALLDYCCEYQQAYGLSFVVAADPNQDVMAHYLRATPLNMLLDDEMVIRYKVEGNIPETLEGNVRALLDE